MIRFRYLFLLTIILASCSFFLTSKDGLDMVLFAEKVQRIDIDSSKITADNKERFTINTEGCTIPVLEPLDKSIESFVKYPSEMPKCPDEKYALLGSNRKKIWVRHNTFQYYKINKIDKISCCYRSFYRPAAVDDIESTGIDDRSKYSLCIYFDNVIEVNDEFVRVACSVGNKTLYEQFFLFAPIKKFKKHGNIPEITAEQNKTAYNVLVLGIDAVSRLNFYRTMPNTANYLRKKGAVEFKGYNKVGDNTFPNLVPMLMGIKVTELKKTCYPYDTATFDNCPFVWEWFKQAGYYTALGEDASNLGTFNYIKTGFSIGPTDYYLHTFMVEAIEHVGACKDFNSFLCMHDTYFYKVLLNYIEQLTWRLSNKKLFGFFWEVSMSHDYLNYPMKMDDDYLKLLTKWETSGYLDKTIVIIVSDHGMRWGDIRHTKQGRLEERLPLLYILPPQSFQNNYKEAYNNLKLNSKRLTTPFDVHATLSDLIDLKNVEKDTIAVRSSGDYAEKRSISLFLPVPENRTCVMADIDDHWCTCHEEVALTKDNPQAFEAAKTLVLLINDMLKDYPQCAKLDISKMVAVTEIKDGEAVRDESTWKEFMVVVKTAPGHGIFEATLRQDSTDLSWKLIGTPSRLNLYGDQSRCVDHYQMKLYCYCS